MRMRNFLFLVTVLAVAMMPGCDKEIDSTVFEQQENRYFELYKDANFPDAVPTESGLYFLEDSVGTGASPDSGDYLLVNYVAYTVPDEMVVDTYSEDWAIDYNIYTSGVLYGPYKYLHGSEIEGLKEGVSMMKEGGIARLVFKSELGYGSAGIGNNIGAYESLMYDVQLLEVIKDASLKEFNQIKAYLDSAGNYITIFDEDTDANMYYFPDVIGQGEPIVDDDVLEVYYTGQLLDGRVFDTNVGDETGLDVTLGEEAVIQGWEIGLTYFNYGGTGKLLIPHPLAYGEEGNLLSGSLKYSIPPYEALLFDIQIEPQSEAEEPEVEE